MENRRSSRKPIRARVMLNSPHFGSIWVDSRNLSLGGMYVETGEFKLPANSTVDIAFWITGGHRQDCFNLRATVVRRIPGGAGLMFVRMETDTIRALSAALSRHDPVCWQTQPTPTAHCDAAHPSKSSMAVAAIGRWK
jgi:hypothetical protein